MNDIENKITQEGKLYRHTKSISKSFKKGTDFGIVLGWISDQIDTNEVPVIELAAGVQTENGPYCPIQHKYTVTITKHFE